MIPAWPPSEHQLLQQGFQSLRIWSGDAAFYDAQLCMTEHRNKKENLVITKRFDEFYQSKYIAARPLDFD